MDQYTVQSTEENAVAYTFFMPNLATYEELCESALRIIRKNEPQFILAYVYNDSGRQIAKLYYNHERKLI
jgi:hypothetical protein